MQAAALILQKGGERESIHGSGWWQMAPLLPGGPASEQGGGGTWCTVDASILSNYFRSIAVYIYKLLGISIEGFGNHFILAWNVPCGIPWRLCLIV